MDTKREFDGSAGAWCKALKHIVGFANGDGGMIVFGLDDDGHRQGLSSTLLPLFDPAKIAAQLHRYASNADVKTVYTEILNHRKRFGFLCIFPATRITVFELDGTYSLADKRPHIVFRSGVVYIRQGAETREARQSDLDRMVERRVQENMRSLLARIERIAELPSNATLIASTPGATMGYILAEGGRGVPVSLAPPDVGTQTVEVRDVLSPDAPFSSIGAEIVTQLRLHHHDPSHRVVRSTLERWYLERQTFTLPPGAAAFACECALYAHGLAMYWASMTAREELHSLVATMLDKATYPAINAVPYVVAGFFWEERSALLGSLAKSEGNAGNAARRVLACKSHEEFLARGRTSSQTFAYDGARLALAHILASDEQAATLFDELVRRYATLSEGIRPVAHQLDLWLHARLRHDRV